MQKLTDQEFRELIDTVKRTVKITDYLGLPGKKQLIRVPWRDDKDASLSIFPHRTDGIQLAQDKGDGNKTYNIITLCAQIEGLSFNAALEKLAGGRYCCPIKFEGSSSEDSGKEKTKKPAPTRTDLPLDQSRYLKLKRLAVPPEYMVKALDMFVDSDRNLCYHTVCGSIHHKGGLVAGGPKTWASWTGDADVAVAIPAGATSIYVFEGVGDALAWMEQYMEWPAIMIMSSANLKAKAIEVLGEIDASSMSINMILDPDAAGDKATAAIKEAFPRARDLRPAYGLHPGSGIDMLDTYDDWRKQWQETP